MPWRRFRAGHSSSLPSTSACAQYPHCRLTRGQSLPQPDPHHHCRRVALVLHRGPSAAMFTGSAASYRARSSTCASTPTCTLSTAAGYRSACACGCTCASPRMVRAPFSICQTSATTLPGGTTPRGYEVSSPSGSYPGWRATTLCSSGTCCTGGRGRSTAPTSSAAGRAGMLGSPSLRLAPCTLASHRRFPRPTHLSLTHSTPKASPSSPSLYAFPARGSLTPPLHPPPPSVVSHPLRGLMHPRVRA